MSDPNEYVAPESVAKLGNVSLIVGVIGAVLSGIAAFVNPHQFFHSYVTGFLWFMAFPLGCLGLLLLHHLSGGAWGVMIRRILEAGTRTLPFGVLAFLPIAAGIHHIYEWSHLDVVAKDKLLTHKQVWLNQNAFLARTALYFVVWLVFTWALNKWSKEQDATGERILTARMRRSSALGLILHILCVTFAAFDWIMSLTPHWYSTIYGLYVLIGQAVTAMAFVCLMALVLGSENGPGIPFQPRHLHDYGKLLFAFVCVWAYFAFSQFVIIWSGNLPEETSWYVPRMHGAWKLVSVVLVLSQYVFPFALLLSRDRKRNARRLAPIALFLLGVRWLDAHWLVAPSFHPEKFTLSWIDLVIPVALGGIWFWLFTVQLRKRSLLPRNEPFLKEALAHE